MKKPKKLYLKGRRNGVCASVLEPSEVWIRQECYTLKELKKLKKFIKKAILFLEIRNHDFSDLE